VQAEAALILNQYEVTGKQRGGFPALDGDDIGGPDGGQHAEAGDAEAEFAVLAD
jgi:hypothetical protein